MIQIMVPDPAAMALFEFDGDPSAYVLPQSMVHDVDAPSAAVACFFPEVIERISGGGQKLLTLPSREPLWKINYNGNRLTVFYPGIGASLAGYSLERAIAAGCRTIVACGAAGALVPGLIMGYHVITVTGAIRDEGTSFHYLPPSRVVTADPDVVEILSKTVEDRGLPQVAGLTWTTDGFFRETPARVGRRRGEGCITVEMESAALLAVASFRGVSFGQYLYAADDLSGEVWEDRNWRNAFEMRRLLFDLAAESAVAIESQRHPAIT
jgi:uridine phosphorylase